MAKKIESLLNYVISWETSANKIFMELGVEVKTEKSAGSWESAVVGVIMFIPP